MPNANSSNSNNQKRALVIASRFNEAITQRLLGGAEETLQSAGFSKDDIEVVWVPGAFEIPVVLHSGLASGKFCLAVALGAVIRGETAHFEYISAEATRGIGEAALRFKTPVGYGLLTCETMEQALARSGGDAGNKGIEAASAAIETERITSSFSKSAEV